MIARRIIPLGSVALLSACGGDDLTYEYVPLPESVLSSTNIEFGEVGWGDAVTRTLTIKNDGELPMGLSGITTRDKENEQLGENFTVSYTTADLVCGTNNEPDIQGGDDTATAASAKGVDSGLAWDSGTTDDEVADPTTAFTIDPGCTLTATITFSPVAVGDVWGSVIVESYIEEANEPSFYRDPDNFKQVVLLHGVAQKGFGNIVVSPRSVLFGHAWEGESLLEYVSVRNVGDGDLILRAPELDPTCDIAFSLSSTYEDGIVVPSGGTTYMEITFEPEDTAEAFCSITVAAVDENTLPVEVEIAGNTGDDPENVGPSCAIRSPDPGYLHTTANDITVELNAFDTNQPADTLFCRIWSTLTESWIADCTPDNVSGHMYVDVPLDDMEAGVDTWILTVRDDSDVECRDSTTVLYRVSYPDSDDDGDGFGDDWFGDSADTGYAVTVDCDDGNRHTYPNAAEIYDGQDNDCDGEIDEDTEGSDDDGDGMTEAEGDCDDDDDETYLGAPEQGDLRDNDCDGIVDEDTVLYDDDGDGYTEADGDCRDTDPNVNPGAIEYCDGLDNDCNGLKDNQDGCIDISTQPIIVGGIDMSVNAVGVGETSTMCVFVWDADGQDISYQWTQDSDLTAAGHNGIDNPIAPCITFTAPAALPDGSAGEAYSLYVVVTDEDGNQDWEFDEITVYPEAVSQDLPVLAVADKGCGGSDDESAAGIVFFVPALLGFGMVRRRRRE